MKKKYLAGLLGGAVLLASAQASATLVNFEDAPSHGLADGDAVTTQYANEGITFRGAYLESRGQSDHDPQGFLNDRTGKFDDPFPTAAGTPGLGNYFLRTQDTLAARGGTGIYLSMMYAHPASSATGQIWDIDGNATQGTEQWLVEAFMGGTLVASATSPLGTTSGPGSLNGLPWTFDLSGVTFDQIEFKFIGSKTRGIGLAFDNFNVAFAVAEPPIASLFGFGVLALVGIGSYRSRRRKTAG